MFKDSRILIIISAVLLFMISCSNNPTNPNNGNNNNNNNDIIDKSKIDEIVASLGDLYINSSTENKKVKFTFSKETKTTASVNNYTVTVNATTETSSVPSANDRLYHHAIAEAVINKILSLSSTVTSEYVLDSDNVSIQNVNDGKRSVKVYIPFKKNNNSGNIILELKLGATIDSTVEFEKLTLSIENGAVGLQNIALQLYIQYATLEGELKEEDEIIRLGTLKTDDPTITYSVLRIEGLPVDAIGSMPVEVDFSNILKGTEAEKKENYTLLCDTEYRRFILTIKKPAVDVFIENLPHQSGSPTGQRGNIKITVKASKKYCNDSNELDIYIQITGKS
ncbi:hypothetical protein Bint_2253 [Brachyspira intermedia PWS/A]|uniref:Lipoprotein n=1 Tax=Brachyspira intermedia (strain ATCC 51140 / PWS/A) TaxID=1045858 RepID=G0EM10_BRAIP|nr:hypothetical protein [Brachyspira intermedia]AEM22859.1 hypothetical protein Bint_2253 [Brachyspira intermedia PWS/A]